MNAAFLELPRPLIRGPALRRALIAGARRVIAQRETLNKINVFPVPDGDTGSNLAFTLGGVLAGALSCRTQGAGDLLRRVGEDAVDGARGNSGAILAQFLTGVAEAVGPVRALEPEALARAVRAGAESARLALSEPREGTILSVIAAFADALEQRGGSGDLGEWFRRGLEHSRRALANTPNQLPVLAKAGVVDAGAQGFVDLLEGIGEFIDSGAVDAVGVADELPADVEAAEAHGELGDADPEHRWCSECLVVGEGLDRAGLRAAVGELGASCVVIAGSGTRLRLHAHVADPRKMFETAARFGRVEGSKADDMHAQARTAAGAVGVAVITDSAADLPEDVQQRLNIHMVPARVNFGDQDYLDKVGLSTAEFYRKLRTELVLPRTSQPPPGDFRRQFEFLLSHHRELVYVGLSRSVSGTLQSAETAAQRGHGARTHIFDTGNASCGEGLLAIRAGEMALAGAGAPEILAELARLKPLTPTWAAARDISHAVRGGRIPAWAKPVVEWLGFTPIAKVKADGKLGVAGGLVGKSRVPERFAAYVAKRVDRGARWRLMVGHCDALADGETLLAALRARLDLADSWLVETGPAVGAHAGPGTLVVSLQPAD
ncbi:DegV family protein [Arenimonas terrae]|uniref:DegV family protein n=1 Tax=Arenimonas terrae TaxID=2546226 RepID=A0A5C4RRF4_9GAMM|nr:DegV family protein [Arenimonas terrae]TNJ33893.1 DegV family protein [Arenimonas terrae]